MDSALYLLPQQAPSQRYGRPRNRSLPHPPSRHRQCPAATQNQAFSALLFLYRHVLDITLDNRINALRAKRSRHLPTVLTPQEARNVIAQMTGVHRIPAVLLYGSGLRLREALQLRIKDIDFA